MKVVLFVSALLISTLCLKIKGNDRILRTGNCEIGTEKCPINFDTSKLANKMCSPRLNFAIEVDKTTPYISSKFSDTNTHVMNPFPLSTLTMMQKNSQKIVMPSLFYHFHLPSVNTIDGVQYDAQIHLLHFLGPLHFATYGILLEAVDEDIEDFFDTLDLNSTTDHQVLFPINFNETAPVYHYRTHPPEGDGLHWFINSQPIKVKRSSIDLLTKLIDIITNNPVQVNSVLPRQVDDAEWFCEFPNGSNINDESQ